MEQRYLIKWFPILFIAILFSLNLTIVQQNADLNDNNSGFQSAPVTGNYITKWYSNDLADGAEYPNATKFLSLCYLPVQYQFNFKKVILSDDITAHLDFRALLIDGVAINQILDKLHYTISNHLENSVAFVLWRNANIFRLKQTTTYVPLPYGEIAKHLKIIPSDLVNQSFTFQNYSFRLNTDHLANALTELNTLGGTWYTSNYGSPAFVISHPDFRGGSIIDDGSQKSLFELPGDPNLRYRLYDDLNGINSFYYIYNNFRHWFYTLLPDETFVDQFSAGYYSLKDLFNQEFTDGIVKFAPEKVSMYQTNPLFAVLKKYGKFDIYYATNSNQFTNQTQQIKLTATFTELLNGINLHANYQTGNLNYQIKNIVMQNFVNDEYYIQGAKLFNL